VIHKTVVWNTVPLEAKGNGDVLTHVRVKDVKTNEERELPANGLFYAIGAPCSILTNLVWSITEHGFTLSIGHIPATELVKGQIDTDSDGYALTVPGTTQTNIKGVFAAGDVQDKRYRQAITSAGTGCMAALEAERLLAEEEEEGAA
jgi:thioredoxin reductase (NADPH)